MKRQITAEKLKTQKKYRKLEVKELVRIIRFEIPYREYEKLPGINENDKARILIDSWE